MTMTWLEDGGNPEKVLLALGVLYLVVILVAMLFGLSAVGTEATVFTEVD